MLSAFERMVAFRYLRARREEGFISITALFSLVGIALGVATLIVVLAVMNGVRGEMVKSIIGLEGHISVYAKSGGLDGYDRLAEQLQALPAIRSAIPKIEGQIMASHKGRALGAMAVGFKAEDVQHKTLLSGRMQQGSLAALSQQGGVVIGNRMAEKLGLKLGDDLTLVSPEGRATIAGMMPRVKAYPVVGIFSIGMFSYDNGLILMPFADAQTFFKLSDNNTDKASMLEVQIDNPDQSAAVAQKVANTLGPGVRVYEWQGSNRHILQAVIVQRNVMFLILLLIIIVASFNIISSLIMLVREKGRDIAILRTMGASRGMVLRIFMLCGASVGIVGTGIGVVLGLLIAFNTESIQSWLEGMTGHKLLADELYFLSHLPAQVDGREVVAVTLLSLLIAFLATLYPARRAASLNPAEALRYE